MPPPPLDYGRGRELREVYGCDWGCTSRGVVLRGVGGSGGGLVGRLALKGW